MNRQLIGTTYKSYKIELKERCKVIFTWYSRQKLEKTHLWRANKHRYIQRRNQQTYSTYISTVLHHNQKRQDKAGGWKRTKCKNPWDRNHCHWLVHNEQKPKTKERIGNTIIIGMKKAGRVQESIPKRSCQVMIQSE